MAETKFCTARARLTATNAAKPKRLRGAITPNSSI